MAHCSQCHETFSKVKNFDFHRYGKIQEGLKCHWPADQGLVQNTRGTWLQPDERDVSEMHKDK